MALFELASTAITGLTRVDFAAIGILERNDLQRLLRDHVQVISPDTLIISEEFSKWDRSDRRIDLLGLDRNARLVVVELKRTSDDALADLQALRYAAMVSPMTFEEAVDVYKDYIVRRNMSIDAQAAILAFLGWNEPSDGRFNEDVRIVLAAPDFSAEVTTTVLWLNERDLDITCVRIQPYRHDASILLDVQQIIPLPEAADFQVQIRQKQRETRTATEQSTDWTRYDVTVEATVHHALSKRDAMLAVVRELVRCGKSPEEIQRAARRGTMFFSLDGDVGQDLVVEELRQTRRNDRQAAQRYFVSDDQLFRVGGRTYALTTQWGSPNWQQVLESLAATFKDVPFSYAASTRLTA